MRSTCSDSCGLQPMGNLFAAESNLPVCCSFFDRTFTWSGFCLTNGHFGVCRYKYFFLEEAMAELAWKIVGRILVHALPRSFDDIQLSLFILQHTQVVVEVTHSYQLVQLHSPKAVLRLHFQNFCNFVLFGMDLEKVATQLCVLFPAKETAITFIVNTSHLFHLSPRCKL